MLSTEELSLIKNAPPQRQSEFAAGRWCARKALEKLGWAGEAILKGDKGEPIWPKGIVGSISHTRGLAIAAVSEKAQAIGVDIESRERIINEGMKERICLENEREWVRLHPVEDRNTLLLLLFSAKESFYKAVYPRLKKPIGFHAVSVQLGEDDFIIHAVGKKISSTGRDSYSGRFTVFQKIVITSVCF